MCTVSWLHQNDGYHLFCNRDEKRTRAQAIGPEIKSRNGVLFIAPTDPVAGGTWIGTNEFGISLCLLNGAPGRPACKSRGLLLPELLSVSSLAEASEHIRRFDLSSFAPFILVILETRGQIEVMAWDGQTAASIEPQMPLVSSSFDPEGVQAKRRDEYHRKLNAAGQLDSSVLLGFHSSHGAEPDAYSPCMHRPDAETVSFSRVKVTESQIEFSYSPGAPCRSSRVTTRKLPRRHNRKELECFHSYS